MEAQALEGSVDLGSTNKDGSAPRRATPDNDAPEDRRSRSERRREAVGEAVGRSRSSTCSRSSLRTPSSAVGSRLPRTATRVPRFQIGASRARGAGGRARSRSSRPRWRRTRWIDGSMRGGGLAQGPRSHRDCGPPKPRLRRRPLRPRRKACARARGAWPSRRAQVVSTSRNCSGATGT